MTWILNVKATILNSRSIGNGVIIHLNNEAVLVLDAGLSFDKVLQAINYAPKKIYCLVTHRHKDHSKYVQEYINRGANVYLSSDMYGDYKGTTKHLFVPDELNCTDYFKFYPVEVQHDVVNFGFVVNSPDVGEFCYFTDTHYIPVILQNCNVIFVEANYCPDIIEKRRLNGSLNEAQYARVRNSHMSITETIRFLKSCNNKCLSGIVLLHLSDGNSDAKLFQEMVAKEVGVRPVIADKNMELNLGF